MSKSIRQHVDDVFSAVEDSQSLRELKEELVANLTEKWNDLCSQGKSGEEALRDVLRDIGNASDYGFAPRWENSRERDQFMGMRTVREAAVDTQLREIALDWCAGGAQILKSGDGRTRMVQKAPEGMPENCLFTYEVSGGTLWIRDNNRGVLRSIRGLLHSPRGTYLQLYLPQKLYECVTIRSASGFVKADGLNAVSLRSENASGFVRLFGSFQEVHCQNSSGQTKMGTSQTARVTGSNHSGSMYLYGMLSEADVRTSSGTVTMETQAACNAQFHCTSGKINARGALRETSLHLSSGKAHLESSVVPQKLCINLTSGVAEIQIPEKREGFHLRLHKASGSFHNAFPCVHPSGSEWMFGEGQAEFRVTIASGVVRLGRR